MEENMRKQAVAPTGREARFGDDEIIVSKTDLKGKVTYANDVFLKVAGYTEEEVLGQPHNFIRHPGMPACVFKLLWETLEGGQEIFAYVLNQAKNGDHYWVFAHVTPSYDKQGNCVGYHSNRRVPYADAMPKVQALYQQLLAEEQRHSDYRAGMEAGYQMLVDTLGRAGVDYSQFVFSLSRHTALERRVA
jgi:PAS domain S-box-containing protein